MIFTPANPAGGVEILLNKMLTLLKMIHAFDPITPLELLAQNLGRLDLDPFLSNQILPHLQHRHRILVRVARIEVIRRTFVELYCSLSSHRARSPCSAPPMPPPPRTTKPTSILTDIIHFLAGSMVALLLVWVLYSYFLNPTASSTPNFSHQEEPNTPPPSSSTFYDDPNLSYSIEDPITNWDEKRQEWLSSNPSFIPNSKSRVLVLTGSQPAACKSPIGDHLLLRFFKNKVDYCRLHSHDIFYNNAFFHPKMPSFWAKLPLVRAAMVAHPESEWIWWVDSDAAFTDMEFKLPLDRYRDHNLVVHGWPKMVYEKRSWVSLNAGVFLIRNCQWSMDFMSKWASMGPQTPDYDEWSKIQRSTLPDKMFPKSDDQSALVYLLLKEKDAWAARIYLESEYYLEGYWKELVGELEGIMVKYNEIERGVRGLRERHAEKASEGYASLRERYVKDAGFGKGSWRRPFITHFTGCQPCSGNHNEMYSGESCLKGMETVLNFADNQVLRNYGLMRRDLRNASSLSQVPYDYPA